MEDPVEDAKKVVLAVLERPTLRRQAETLKKYCTEDVEFYYLYFNTKGISEMIATYQLAQILANYQTVEFKNISYDPSSNSVSMWTNVYIQPYPLYWNGRVPLSIFTLLELEDTEVEHGMGDGSGKRTVKLIKRQRDWFEYSPVIRVLPFIGDLYANYQLRFILGNMICDTVIMGFKLLEYILPSKLAKPIFG